VAHGLGYLQELPVDRFADFVWFMLNRNREKRDVAVLRAKLWQPAVGEVVSDPRSPWSRENEAGSLAAFKRGLGG